MSDDTFTSYCSECAGVIECDEHGCVECECREAPHTCIFVGVDDHDECEICGKVRWPSLEDARRPGTV